MAKKATTEEFIMKARKIHGDRYDYSKVNYVNSKTKVNIVCPKHGEFEQTPGSHLRGRGCFVCGGKENLSTEKFIIRAREIHGLEYDYSLVKYINNSTKVKIICPIHGEFEQSPAHHFRGQGCRKCMKYKLRSKFQLTKEKFIEKSRKAHGGKYDYSLVEYKNAHHEIEIICPEHGIFVQSPNLHMRGNGCPKCSIEDRRTYYENIFIEKSKNKFPQYDYSKVFYKNRNTKVEIICATHGSFFKSPYTFLKGAGCPKCKTKKKKCWKYNNENKEWFVEKANKVFNFKYGYSKLDFGVRNKIVVICPTHGDFEVIPYKHLNGQGCKKCSMAEVAKNKSMTIDYFLEKSKIVHGMYTYKDLNFKNSQDKIKIICPKHGEFEQKINNHLNGQGCPRCAYSNSSKAEKKWLKGLNIEKLECSFIIQSNDRRFIIDGFDPSTNTIYEYLGSFWHGNPEIYDPDEVNPKNGKKFGFLYKETMERINILEQDGYNVIVKWGK